MAEIILKKATLKDWQEIAALERVASSKTYSARFEEDEAKDFIKDEFVFLIKKGDDIVGLVAYEEIKRGGVHINGLVITPQFRRKGFAREAMTLALKKMTKYSRIELVVHPHNNPAISLYLSLGFIIESWQDNYFGDGEPRLMLAKK